MLSSEVERLLLVEEGITCDPFRFIKFVITGVPSQAFMAFDTESFDWWIRRKCKVPWLSPRSGGDGWQLEYLPFDVGLEEAQALAKLASDELKKVVAAIRKLPWGFRALVRKLKPEPAADDDGESSTTGAKSKKKTEQKSTSSKKRGKRSSQGSEKR